MYYAQFFAESLTEPGVHIHALGDRAVYRLDGRNSLHTMINDARDWARRHPRQGWTGFIIKRGVNILRGVSSVSLFESLIGPEVFDTMKGVKE